MTLYVERDVGFPRKTPAEEALEDVEQKEEAKPEPQEEPVPQAKSKKQAKSEPKSDEPRCPKCGNTELTANRTQVVGVEEDVETGYLECTKCGYVFSKEEASK